MDAQQYDSQNVGQLKAEIDKRNTDRAEDAKIAPPGANKSDLIAALQLDDEQKAGLAATGATSPTRETAEIHDGNGKVIREVVQEIVTLVHPDHDAEVQVFKPSADYTNYVRGYGYREAEEAK